MTDQKPEVRERIAEMQKVGDDICKEIDACIEEFQRQYASRDTEQSSKSGEAAAAAV